jgi:hypothetical protein
VHETAMPGVLPLPMAAGIALEVLTAGVTSGRRRHRGKERRHCGSPLPVYICSKRRNDTQRLTVTPTTSS